jgi:hypothetical protein
MGDIAGVLDQRELSKDVEEALDVVESSDLAIKAGFAFLRHVYVDLGAE